MSGNYARENRETSPVSGTQNRSPDRDGKPKAQSVRECRRGVEQRRSTSEAAEQTGRKQTGRRLWREGL